MLNEWVERLSVRWSMTGVLSVAIAGLVGLALAVTLAIQIYVGRNATTELFRAKGDLLVELIANRVREQLDPASSQLSFIAEMLSQPDVNYTRNRIADLMTGALAGAPQIDRLVFLYPDARAIVVDRGADAPKISFPNLADNPDVREGLREANVSVAAAGANSSSPRPMRARPSTGARPCGGKASSSARLPPSCRCASFRTSSSSRRRATMPARPSSSTATRPCWPIVA